MTNLSSISNKKSIISSWRSLQIKDHTFIDNNKIDDNEIIFHIICKTFVICYYFLLLILKNLLRYWS